MIPQDVDEVALQAFEGIPVKLDEEEQPEEQPEYEQGYDKQAEYVTDYLKQLCGEYGYEKTDKMAKIVFFLVTMLWIGTWLYLLGPFGAGDEHTQRHYSHHTVTLHPQHEDMYIPEGMPSMKLGDDNDPRDIPLLNDGASFSLIMRSNEHVFVNYFVTWCQWSTKFRPVWRELMESSNTAASKITLLEINCEVHKELCAAEGVYAYPTLRFYEKTKAQLPNYAGSRTVGHMNQFFQRRLDGFIDDGVRDEEPVDRALLNDLPQQTLAPVEEDPTEYVPFEGKNLNKLLEHNKYVFVDFMAPFCVWSLKLNPVFDQLAKEGFGDAVIIRVDCVAEAALCREHKITAFPTLRFFESGKQVKPDYKLDRTLVSFRSFLASRISVEKEKVDGDFTTGPAAKVRYALSRGLDQEGPPKLRASNPYLFDPLLLTLAESNEKMDEEQFYPRPSYVDNDDYYVDNDDRTVEGEDDLFKDDLFKDENFVDDFFVGTEPWKTVRSHTGVKGTQSGYASDNFRLSDTNWVVIEEEIEEPAKRVALKEWELDIEYAVRARNVEKLWSAGENVIVAFTSSFLSDASSFRPIWHEFAHRVQQSGVLSKLVVAEIDCATGHCSKENLDQHQLPYYIWYHKGQQVGDFVNCNELTVESLLSTSSMMIDMEKKHTAD